MSPIDYIKVGYVVKFRDGELAMVRGWHEQNSQKEVLVFANRYNKICPLNGYSFDLKPTSQCKTFTNASKDNDVMEIYGYSFCSYETGKITIDYRQLMWKRTD